MHALDHALATLGFDQPTEVQRSVWEPFRAGRDLVVQAPTGSGKTLAYLLPLLAALDPTSKNLQALVLVPTQELAIQIQHGLAKAAPEAVRAVVLMGGVNLSRQLDQLKSKPHLVIGTPGRVLELLEKRKITGHYLATVVLDEADRLFDPALLPSVRSILKTTLKTRQTTLFSASIPASVEALARELLRDPQTLRLGERVPAAIAHWQLRVERRDKVDVVRKLLSALQPERTLVFLNQPEQIEMVAEKLRFHGVEAESLHGSRFKADRQRALEGFAKGSLKVLVASDLAARGLHIEGVTHVVHFDVPTEALDYQHRCGRTGRAGVPGVSVLLADEVEETRLRAFEKTLGIEVQVKDLRHGKLFDRR